jgi:hypothetical protein
MSGLLRRIKRARAAGGEPSAEGAPTASGGAPVTSDPAAGPAGGGSSAASGPGGGSPTASGLAGSGPAATTGPAGSDAAEANRPAGGASGRETPQQAEATPAGIDPAAAPLPPKGRRSRHRKRLRYLRRARELMLRDLGGLLYEIHRTGGGHIDTHAAIIGPKVARLAALDQEAHAIERALGAPRGETVVFEPGVGGACAVCGELYPNGARFCANCGTATTAPAASPEAPATPAPGPAAASAAEPAPGPAARPAPPPDPDPGDERPTSQLPAESSSPPLGLASAAQEPEASGAMNGHAPNPDSTGTDKDGEPTDPLAAREARRP